MIMAIYNAIYNAIYMAQLQRYQLSNLVDM